MKEETIKLSEREKELIVKDYYENSYELLYHMKTGTTSDFLEQVPEIARKCEDYRNWHTAIYKISAKEVKAILSKMIADNSLQMKISETDNGALRSCGKLLLLIPSELWTEKMVCTALNQDPKLYDNFPEEMKTKYFCQYIARIKYTISTESFSQEELIAAINYEPEVYEHLSKEEVTRELLHAYLKKCARDGYNPKCFYWQNVPEELKDKTYYQAKAMENPYYLSECPEQYRSAKLIEFCVNKMLTTDGYYTEALSLLRALKEDEITEEIAFACCKKHFSGITLIPKAFKNDEFYKKLMDAGQYMFLHEVDFETISTDLILECLKRMKVGQFWFWHEKFPKKIWTPEIVMEYARVSNQFYAHVPKKSLTKEACIINLKHHKSLENFPKEWLDAEVIDIAMGNSYGIIDKIPDEYKTEEFYKKHITNCNLSFKDIPEEYITKDVVIAYATAGKTVDFTKIPQKIITKEIIQALYNNWNKYHFSQGHQTPEICRWIYEVLRDNEGLKVVGNNLYMLPHLSEDMIKELHTEFTAKDILKKCLSSYITEEMCAILYAMDADCIIYMPERIRATYRAILNGQSKQEKKEPVEEKVVKLDKKVAEKEADECIISTFTQLSLFDFIA